MRPTLGTTRSFTETVKEIEANMRGTLTKISNNAPESERPIDLPFTAPAK